MSSTRRIPVVLASYLEPELVERLRAVDPRLEIVHEPRLVPRPRYPSDHVGSPLSRSEADEAVWRRHLARAEILFDFDRTNTEALPELAPGVRWIQATSAGIGRYVRDHGYVERMPDTVFTTARGVHARPLAEFAALAMIAFSRGLFRMLDLQRERRWERFAGTDLVGRTVVVFGHGAIGRQVGAVAGALGMRVIGIKRTVAGIDPRAVGADELYEPGALREQLPRADFLVLAAPHTDETAGIIGAEELALLPRTGVVVNVGRGSLVDEPALVAALRDGRIAGAVLDVFAEEPLPADSPLWDMPNVLVSPHSASTSDRENERITELFRGNLRRYLSGEPLVNVLDPARLY